MSSSSSAHPFSEKPGETEVPSVIYARLGAGGKVLVDDIQMQDELRTKGFGEKEDADFVLKSYEALFLLQTRRLLLTNKPDISFDLLFELLFKYDKELMTNFLVYRDLRSRGYVAKEGFGFGNDFRVYERGDYEKKPAKYVVFGIREGVNTSAKDFAKTIEQIEKMGKEPVIAVVERRGEIIYYKASKMRFTENKHRQNSE